MAPETTIGAEVGRDAWHWDRVRGLTGTTGTPRRRRSARDEQLPDRAQHRVRRTAPAPRADPTPLSTPTTRPAPAARPIARSAGVSPIIAVLAGGTRVAWQSATSIAGLGSTPTPSSPHAIGATSPHTPSPRSVASVGTRSSVVATAMSRPRAPQLPEQFRQIRRTAPPKRPDPARTRPPRPPGGPPGRWGTNAGRPRRPSPGSRPIVATVERRPRQHPAAQGIEPDCREDIPRHRPPRRNLEPRAEASRAQPLHIASNEIRVPSLSNTTNSTPSRAGWRVIAGREEAGGAVGPTGRSSISCRGVEGEPRRGVRSGQGSRPARRRDGRRPTSWLPVRASSLVGDVVGHRVLIGVRPLEVLDHRRGGAAAVELDADDLVQGVWGSRRRPSPCPRRTGGVRRQGNPGELDRRVQPVRIPEVEEQRLLLVAACLIASTVAFSLPVKTTLKFRPRFLTSASSYWTYGGRCRGTGPCPRTRRS